MKLSLSLVTPLLLIPLLFATTFVATVAADPTLIDDRFSPDQTRAFEEVQGNVMSPYCPGRLLRDCPSTAARDLKLEIKQRILSGESAEVIIESLLEDFGEEMRAVPETSGIGMLAWVAPAAFLLVGLVVLLLWIRSQARADNE